MIRILIITVALLAALGSVRAETRPPMVAAAHPLAAEAGMAVLRDGGSAVDAAIAVQAVLTLVEPQSSGIGGGAFMLHWRAESGRLEAYDGRETAPAAATAALFLNDDGTPLDFFEAVVGGRSVGAPGVLRMLELAHADHGRLEWARLFEDAIRLSRDGFEVTPRLHYLLDRDRYLKASPTAAPYFYDADGAAWPVGHVLRNPALAETLSLVAEGGADALHEGPVAADIVAAVRGHADNPGLLSEADLAGYAAKRRPPVCMPYRAHRVCGMPPPTSGGVAVAQILGMLSRFDLGSAGPAPVLVHLVAEAEKRAYADRARFLADSDFVDVPVAELLDPDYLARRAAEIDVTVASGDAAPGLPRQRGLRDGDDLTQPATTHFVIADAAGNVVSMTSSVENAFGSRIFVRGFLLNNQLTDFSFAPEDADGLAVANRVEPGKRPRSSMSPTIVLDREGGFRLAIGSPGGSRIIGYVARTLIGVLDLGLTVQQAIDLPNFVNRNGATDLEDVAEVEDMRRALEAMGHVVNVRGLNSGLHGIEQVEGAWRGGADPRREGVVLGTE
ncbi:gamma-glutamyltransferase [Minwuia thermotolerans]|uniref:Glutathione hydrolase proenzyme n=1 Tax=Minwuia thermotolerans TaxID=2056226 RepID=A0A2M9G5N8_9PROT|nr:gamma-glutamyltransferase [Minwuia thermotolerans]PJK31037.1 gamma-glutamyltransferase [Minwuia thermotolerans]